MAHEITPADDGNHFPGPDHDERFQESWCIGWYDPDTRLGGFQHLGLQHVRGIADSWSWMTHEGKLIHKFQNNELPLPKDDFKDLRLQPFHLKSQVPLTKRSVSIRHSDAEADLLYEAFTRPFNFSMDTKGADIAKSHYESSGYLSGQVRFGGRTIDVKSLAFQDHSWGPRDYGKILAHRWMWACFGEDLFFSAFHITGPSGHVEMGYVFDRGEFHGITGFNAEVGMSNDGLYPMGVVGVLRTASKRGYRFTGRCDGSSVATHRDGFMISDSCTVFEMGGRIGTGLVEVNELKRPTPAIRMQLGLD